LYIKRDFYKFSTFQQQVLVFRRANSYSTKVFSPLSFSIHIFKKLKIHWNFLITY
jgi:hypothetical protein